MPNIPPQPKLDQIVWFENHYPTWLTTPTAFGITAAQATAVKTATQAARAAYDSAQAARQSAKNATVSQDQQVQTMLTVGRDVVNLMKGFIEQSGNTSLWGLSGLEPPAPRGTTPDPTAPFALSATLDSEGNVILRWKTSQPTGVSGVIYTVRRSIDDGPFTLVDTVGEKAFTDDTIQAGTRSVSYTVQAKRGRQVSPVSEALSLRFGHGGGAGFSITSATSAKLAA